jgi:hypothetical protein
VIAGNANDGNDEAAQGEAAAEPRLSDEQQHGAGVVGIATTLCCSRSGFSKGCHVVVVGIARNSIYTRSLAITFTHLQARAKEGTIA